MKNAVDSHHRKTDYPLYVHKVPAQHRAPSGNPWDSLERSSQRPLPAVPAELCIRITDRAPHELSRTTLSVIDLLLNVICSGYAQKRLPIRYTLAPLHCADGCEPIAPTTKAFSTMCADSDAQ